MNILIYSPVFLPITGGLQTVADILAREFLALGHQVRIVTYTPAHEPVDSGYTVIRQPSARAYLCQMRWCDVYLQMNISLKGIWPLLLAPRSWFIHYGGYPEPGIRGRLKRIAMHFANVIPVSEYIADRLGLPAHDVIVNPYREDIFRPISGVIRENDILFVGRLVEEKGVDILIRAVSQLRNRGIDAKLSIVGEGPNRPSLEGLVEALALRPNVDFLGVRAGHSLAVEYNSHRIVVVPSRFEPFGIVAIEALACGCTTIVAGNGGLIEAIGDCGLVVSPLNVDNLEDILVQALASEQAAEHARSAVIAHLERFSPVEVAPKYLARFDGHVLDAGA